MSNLTGKQTRELSDLIHMAYSDALAPSVWSEVLSFLKRYMAADAGIALMFYPQSGKPIRHIASDIDPALFEQYRKSFVGREPHVDKAISKGHRFWRPTDVISRRIWEKSELYNELLAPLGYHQFAAAAVLQDGKPIVRLHITREDSKRPFSRTEMRILALLQPHLEQALHQSNLVSSAVNARTTLECALDSTPHPVLILGRLGAIAHMNSQAIEFCPGPKDMSNPSLAQIQSVVMGLINSQSTADGSLPKPMTTRCMISGRECRLRVYPVRLPSGRPHYVVGIEPNGMGLRMPLQAAMQELGLSSAEAEVCMMIVGGISDQEISDRLKIPDSEVEQCVLRILEKLQVADRTGVAAKMLGL